MSYLGIDYGAKKIGVAKSDSEGQLALPLIVIRYENLKDVAAQLGTICKQENIQTIVVGAPITTRQLDSSTANQQLNEAKSFATWLESELKISVILEDERFSTQAAGTLRQGMRGDDDATAAMLILQSYLDRQNR
jgi:putative Holliday junction resolvase